MRVMMIVLMPIPSVNVSRRGREVEKQTDRKKDRERDEENRMK